MLNLNCIKLKSIDVVLGIRTQAAGLLAVVDLV